MRHRLMKWWKKFTLYLYRKSQRAPKMPPMEEIQVVIPRTEFYEVWDKQIKEAMKKLEENKDRETNA